MFNGSMGMNNPGADLGDLEDDFRHVNIRDGAKDDNVLDFTKFEFEEDEDQPQHHVRLTSGINVHQLLDSKEGVIFEPEIDQEAFK